MLSKITCNEMSEVLIHALRERLIEKDDTSVIFYDVSRLTARIKDLTDLFPSSTLHAIAVKANPLTWILQHINSLGAGVEVASLPELMLAERAGFPPEKIAFDSPVKTISELEYALNLGVHINADSFEELERIASLQEKQFSRSKIGIRINPQVGTGKIAMTSVAGKYSKFGVDIKENRNEIMNRFLRYNWLKGVHLHIGSAGCGVDLLLDGIKVVLDFVNEANTRLSEIRNEGISIFDIGGGLPVSYHQIDQAVSMKEYRDKIESVCPILFTDKFQLITEFGRYIHANTGWVASRVEYVKKGTNVNTAIIHVGADLFLRKCYNPQDWHHDITVADNEGKIKPSKGINKRYFIAGPLCFGGDIIEKGEKEGEGIQLPEIEQGDYILIHDTGAYTLSMWSRYNSRQVPKVIAYYEKGKSFDIIKSRESFENILKFWS